MTDTAIPPRRIAGAVSGLGTALHLGVSAASLGALGLLVLWGWQTVGRDVADVPVLQAQAGVMRVLPPPAEDMAPAAPVLSEIAAVARGEGVPPAPVIAKLRPEGAGLAPEDLVRVRVEAPPVFAAAAAAAPAILETVALSVPGVGRSPRPLPRGMAAPSKLLPVGAAAGALAAGAPPAGAPPAGAPLAQVGAFRTEAAARSDWGRLAGRHGALFAARVPVIAQVSAQGRDLYLLRAGGFETPLEAAVFCAALSAAGTECLPATQR